MGTSAAALIDVEIVGDSRDVEMRLEGLARALDNNEIADFLRRKANDVLSDRMKRRFESEGDEITGRWMSLRPYTVRERQKHGFPGEHPINVRTGSMKRHLIGAKPRVESHSLGATMWAPGPGGGKDFQKKLKVAQMGDARTVARPVLGMDERDLENILMRLGEHFASHQPFGGAGVNIL